MNIPRSEFLDLKRKERELNKLVKNLEGFCNKYHSYFDYPFIPEEEIRIEMTMKNCEIIYQICANHKELIPDYKGFPNAEDERFTKKTEQLTASYSGID